MTVMLAPNEERLIDEAPSSALLAWAGWQMVTPSQWHPLKLLGSPAKGSMMVGDAACAMFSVHWERPRHNTIQSGREWVNERLSKLGLAPDPAPPAAKQFSACGWAFGVQSEEEKQTAYWYGYSEPGNLLLGIKVNGVLPEDLGHQITMDVLPTLRVSASRAPTSWAMHEMTFVSPEGFNLSQRHLFAGDVALEFVNGQEQTLMLRQVYPGDLAMKRRSIDLWLQRYPFKEHRKLHRSSQRMTEWYSTTRPELVGTQREARKRLGFPLGLVRPRWTHALAVHDQNLNRLLIGELMTASRPDQTICERAIEDMNRFGWGG